MIHTKPEVVPGRHILKIALMRDWQGFKYFTPSSCHGHLSGGTGKKVAGPAESGSSLSVGLARKTLKVNLCKTFQELYLKVFFMFM